MLVWRPLSIAVRYVAIIASAPPAVITPSRDQLVGVELARARMLGDLLVHQRLRDHRLVGLVVAEAAEADEVDEHVAVELLAVLHRHLDREQADLRIVGVDVEDRRLGHLGDVGAVERAAGVARIGRREADLVVDRRCGWCRPCSSRGSAPCSAFPGSRPARRPPRRRGSAPAAPGRPSSSPRRCWRARTEPSTTGLTASRCDGLNASVRCIGPPGVITSDEKPWWYFTSPAESSCACLPSNSENRSAGILPSVLTSTLRRPRCAMPITISCTPAGAGELDQVVEHRDHRLAALAREALLADVLGVQVALERLGRGQPLEDVALLLGACSSAASGSARGAAGRSAWSPCR